MAGKIMSSKFALLVCGLLVALCLVAAEKKVVQIQVMTRHGARTTLPKTPKLFEGGSALTPIGERQHYNLGAWIRNKYKADGDDPLDLHEFDYRNTILTTSEFDRTMVSATSLLLGLFPDETRSNDLTGDSYLPDGVTRANIPLRVMENEHDIYIRAYDKCPSFVSDLESFYKTKEFKEKERVHLASGLLYKLGEAPQLAKFATKKDDDGKAYVPLEQIWNAFDEMNVAKTECGVFDPDYEAGKSLCDNMVDPALLNFLSDAEWDELKKAAYWAELKKYGRENTRGRLGNILLEMTRMMGAVDGKMPAEMSPGQLNSFVLYSAHYPTILGALSAMDFSKHNPDILSARFPEYASALILELHYDEDSNEYFVRLLYKDGDEDHSGTYLALGETCDKDAYCPFEAFAAVLKTNVGFEDDEGWCDACANTVTRVCKLHDYEKLMRAGYITIGCLGCLSFILAAALAFLLIIRRRSAPGQQAASSEQGVQGGAPLPSKQSEGVDQLVDASYRPANGAGHNVV